MHLKDDASVVNAALHAYMHMLCHVLHIIFNCICMYCHFGQRQGSLEVSRVCHSVNYYIMWP